MRGVLFHEPEAPGPGTLGGWSQGKDGGSSPEAMLFPHALKFLPWLVQGGVALGPVWHRGSCLLLWDGYTKDFQEGAAPSGSGRKTSQVHALMEGLQRQGWEFLKKLDGPFRLVWVDLSSGDWIMARGPQGLRPLFWLETEQGLFFGRDIPSLVDLLGFVPEPNWERIPEYLVFQDLAGGETLFRHVMELLPGQVIRGRVGCKGFRASKLDLVPQGGFSNCCSGPEGARHAIFEAIRATLPQDRNYPLGLFLSGGVDSSLLAWTLIDLGGQIHRSFTITCPGYRYDEGPFAKMVAQQLELVWEAIPLDPASFSTSWAWALESSGLPMISTNQVPWWILCQKAAGFGIQEVFSGEGADGWISGGLYDDEIEALRLAAGDPGQQAAIAILCKTHTLNHPTLVQEILDLPLDLTSRIRLWEECCNDSPGAPPEDVSVLYHVRTVGHRLLTRANLVAQAHGVNLRLPFLHKQFVSWVRSLPWEQRSPHGVRKAPLKALCASKWGAQLAYRRKIGFPFPLRTWIRDAADPRLRNWREMLLAPETLGRPMYRRPALEKEVRARLEGARRPVDWLLWSLINLELWLRWVESHGQRVQRNGLLPPSQGSGAFHEVPEGAG